jgi:hypothetical protein
MLVSKKGMSALQIMRYMGFGSYKTAWLMCHKIRVALTEDIEQLGGIVEVDETFVSGKGHNKHKDKRPGKKGGGGVLAGKTAVVGAVKRKGNVVARVIENVRASTLTAFVQEAVSHKVSLLCTDQWTGYKGLSKQGYPHATVDHSMGEYVVGAVHTNTIEGFSLSAVASAPSTRSAKSTCTCMSLSSSSAITIDIMRIFSERPLGGAECISTLPQPAV